MSMEHNGGTGNQNLSHNALCRTGCGFYGNSAFEGMCSKCYKDALKRRQQNPSPPQVTSMTAAGRVSPSIGTNLASMELSSRSSPVGAMTTTPSVETASPTIPTPSPASQDESPDDKEIGATGGVEVASEDKDKDGDKEKKPKKNRCHTCKKKVGLTGFQCRCGGLYCSMHRYSDKHGCTFNYKEMAQEQIRKNNPVVVGEKIQKI